MLWDGGSTLSLITFSKARSLQLRGKSVKLVLSGVGDMSTSIDSIFYRLKLITSDGIPVEIEAFGMEKISSKFERIDIKLIVKIFQISSDEINRPQDEEVDLLIGQQAAALLPVRIGIVDSLRLMSN